MDLISSDSPLAFSTEAALRALAMVANLHHIPLEPETLAHQMGWALPGQVQLKDVLRAAQHVGLKAKLVRKTADRLKLLPLPALAVVHAQGEDGQPHPKSPHALGSKASRCLPSSGRGS